MEPPFSTTTSNPDSNLANSTARLTGIWYLTLAISGMIGFLVLHPKLFTGDAQQTLKQFTDQGMLSRLRLIMELIIVASQALTAIWFYKLFKDLQPVSAWAIACWGTVNAVIILISAIAMGVAIETAQSTLDLTTKTTVIYFSEAIVSNAWKAGGLFFGLWLLPMGLIITRTKCMPGWLGRILLVGGTGYILSTIIGYLGITGQWVGLLTLPATIGELWIIGYMLIFGIRKATADVSK